MDVESITKILQYNHYKLMCQFLNTNKQLVKQFYLLYHQCDYKSN